MKRAARYCYCLAIVVGCVWMATAQNTNPAVQSQFQALRNADQRLTVNQRNALSVGLRSMLAMASRATDGGAEVPGGDAGIRGSAPLHGGASSFSPGLPVAVSSAALDYTLSRAGGFSQSQTSTAWCGQNVVTGFDNLAVAEQGFSNGGPISLSDAAFSHDAGQTFSDIGGLNPGTSVINSVGGDPVVVCASPSRFYYASLFFTGTFIDQFTVSPLLGMALNISDDGGQTWSEPIGIALTACCDNLYDREWLAIDPSNPNNLYLSFTRFSFSGGPDSPCPNDNNTGLDIVSSSDGGHTWSAPRELRTVCGASHQTIQSSQVAVGTGGQVYLAYLVEGPGDSQRTLLFRASVDHGATFGAESIVTEPQALGIFSFLQGFLLGNEDPSMTVDFSRGPSRGTIYIAWADGRGSSTIDVLSPTGRYQFGTVMISKSADGGATWLQPLEVSPPDPEFTGAGRDQFQPGVAVDSTGRVAVCFYDRGADSENNLVDRNCSVSADGGATFSRRVRLTASSWIPTHAVDFDLPSLSLSDYDSLAADHTGAYPGFFSAFQVEVNGNLDVLGGKIQ